MKEDKTKSSDKNNKQGWADSLLNIISIPLAGIVIISVTVVMGCAGGQGPGGWMGVHRLHFLFRSKKCLKKTQSQIRKVI